MVKEYIERESLLVGIGSPESGLDDIINTLIFEHNLDFLHDCDEDEVRVFAKDLISNVRNYIQTEPAADVVPVKHGRWLDMDVLDAHYQPVYKCSECGKEVADYYIDNHKYCLHCGTLMDGGNK